MCLRTMDVRLKSWGFTRVSRRGERARSQSVRWSISGAKNLIGRWELLPIVSTNGCEETGRISCLKRPALPLKYWRRSILALPNSSTQLEPLRRLLLASTRCRRCYASCLRTSAPRRYKFLQLLPLSFSHCRMLDC